VASQQAAVAVEQEVEQEEQTRQERQVEQPKKPKRQPRYNVLLWNSDDHSFEYVVAMMQSLFGYPAEKGWLIAEEVHTRGRAIVVTTTKEHAELKRDQIHAFGKDSITASKGSMWSTIEPVS